jgi:hypothetical protein
MSNILEDPHGKGRSKWFGLSMLLHILAVLALLFLTPVRKILFEKLDAHKAPQVNDLSTRQLEEVVAQLDSHAEKQIERNLEAMQELLDQMQSLNDSQLEEYTVFEKSQVTRTPEVVKDSLTQAMEAMEQAKEKFDAKDLTGSLTQQALAQSHQESVLDYLEFLKTSPQIQETHQKATETQARALSETEVTKAAREKVESLERRLDYPTKQVAALEPKIPKMQEAVEAAKKRIEEAKAKLEETKTALEASKAAGEKEDKVKRAETRVAYAVKGVESAEKSLGYKESELQRTQERIETSRAQVKEYTSEKATQETIANESAANAAADQAKAIRLQADVADKIKEEITRKVSEIQATFPEAETMQVELVKASQVQAPENANLLDLYQAAQDAEKQLAEKYRQGRAMQLVVIQDVPFNAAMDAIDLVVPNRPGIPQAPFQGKPADGQQLQLRKQAIRTALAETGSMVTLGHSLLSQAIAAQKGFGAGGGGPVSLDAINAKSASMQALEKLAGQESGGYSADVSQAMQYGGEGKVLSDVPPEQVPVIDDKVIPKSGRKVAPGGDGTSWMAVNQWYMLGPFANPARANIDRVFPPETLVDLNAVYDGKYGRPIRWVFSHSEHKLGRNSPENEEPYGIWYAYTDLHFDQPRDLWISMGSDDKGQVWINDTLVWVSANHHKNWSPKEALRKVHFQKGRNRILYRIENGQHGMAFSLWVNLQQS